MPDKPKIDEVKMDQASEFLKQMISLANNYNELLKTFSPQEKVVAGGVVFCIRNFWADVRMVGVMVDRQVAADMIDTLVRFYQNPESFQPGVQLIQPAEGKSGEPN